MSSEYKYQMALEDFHKARSQASLQLLLARLTGKSIDLLPFDDISRKLRVAGGSDQGLKDIPLDAIVGSVGRYADFTRNFLPRRESDRDRWVHVKAVMSDPLNTGMDPIDVYKIGDVYFVKDGHHRVSAARQLGAKFIQANVTEIRTKIPLSPNESPEDLILKEEYAEFLKETRIDQILPDANLILTFPGMYHTLKEHIAVHRYYMGLELKSEIKYEDAVKHWYQKVYLPVINTIHEQGIMHDFPGKTETDLYLWVSDHRTFLETDYGWKVSNRVAASDLAEKNSPVFSRAWKRASQRLVDLMVPDQFEKAFESGYGWLDKGIHQKQLFTDILVPLNGFNEGWQALEQGILLAKFEKSRLLGLHIVADKNLIQSEEALRVQERFDQRLIEEGIAGNMVIDNGEVARIVSDRAALSDLVILNMAHPPGQGVIAKLESGLRTILHRTPRPILAVPGETTACDQILLAYDGSPKGKEALFIAAYFASRWKYALTVVVVPEKGKATPATCSEARAYLDAREAEAAYLCHKGDVAEVILQTAKDNQSNIIIMGGYGYSPVLEVVLGSTLDRILREAWMPVLICQ
jgi:nucleotide-binding universal stress UspA family protein